MKRVGEEMYNDSFKLDFLSTCWKKLEWKKTEKESKTDEITQNVLGNKQVVIKEWVTFNKGQEISISIHLVIVPLIRYIYTLLIVVEMLPETRFLFFSI